MGIGFIIFGVVVGVILLGWVYHRYTTQTVAVLDQAANTVNTVIDDIKNKKL